MVVSGGFSTSVGKCLSRIGYERECGRLRGWKTATNLVIAGSSQRRPGPLIDMAGDGVLVRI